MENLLSCVIISSWRRHEYGRAMSLSMRWLTAPGTRRRIKKRWSSVGDVGFTDLHRIPSAFGRSRGVKEMSYKNSEVAPPGRHCDVEAVTSKRSRNAPMEKMRNRRNALELIDGYMDEELTLAFTLRSQSILSIVSDARKLTRRLLNYNRPSDRRLFTIPAGIAGICPSA